MLAILAFPLLWRPYGTPPMPGLHDGNPALGLALTLAAVWLAVVLTALRHRVVRPGTRVVPQVRVSSLQTRVMPRQSREMPLQTREMPAQSQVMPRPPHEPTLQAREPTLQAR